MKDQITFSVDGKEYVLPKEAYENGEYVILPNRRIFRIMRWLETLPPQPELEEVEAGTTIYYAREE